MKDAQQQIIDELRREISILRDKIETLGRNMDICRGRTKCPADEVLAEWLEGCIRIDDPVVTGLVESLECYADSSVGQPNDYDRAQKALSAYEARVKSIEVPLQNHGHLNIDYKYNNETTTMSPARVKELGK